jgi:hypothetical protein
MELIGRQYVISRCPVSESSSYIILGEIWGLDMHSGGFGPRAATTKVERQTIPIFYNDPGIIKGVILHRHIFHRSNPLWPTALNWSNPLREAKGPSLCPWLTLCLWTQDILKVNGVYYLTYFKQGWTFKADTLWTFKTYKRESEKPATKPLGLYRFPS